ncbi:hypothetical protein [Bacillus sp. OK048]|uniref:hypothetical protein n=1 Tax=Bacillus sp. OK048 TaxID=1882761 RepID=UPI000881B44A|nr:hypothetical protein [Bacillus sp. OK048]SDM34697.1 hypothetical protein SAMN05443253_1034 [Bacillus sp. OK048]
MFNEEYELLLKKSTEVAPEWLINDIEGIIGKAGKHVGVSYVISELHEGYTFNLKHIMSAINFSDEWTKVSRERLNFIDNNIEIIVALYNEIRNKL